jgi:beta-lactamase class A
MRVVALLQCRTVKKISLNKVLLVIIISSACSASTITQTSSPAASTSPAAKGAPNDLDQSFVRIAAKAQGRVGFAARVLETGEETGLNSSEHYPMHSVYKLPISMAVLRRVDAGELKLDQMVEIKQSDFVRQGMYSPIRDKNPNGARLALAEILRYAVAESDGTASDVLMKLVGGPQAVMAFLNEIKVSGITVVNSENEIGRDWQTQYENWATPSGAVELLAALQAQRGLSAASQKLLFKLLTESIPGAKRLKEQLPAGAIVAHKTGTGGTRNGLTSATNDIGIITLPDGRHLAVAVFVSDSKADLNTREAVIAEIAKALWDKWGSNSKTQ